VPPGHAARAAAMQIFSDPTRGRRLGAMRLPAAGQGTVNQSIAQATEHGSIAMSIPPDRLAPPVVLVQWLCLAVGRGLLYDRATRATQTDGHRARRTDHRAGIEDRTRSVLRRSKCQQSAVRSGLYRTVVRNSVGGVADVQRRLLTTNPNQGAEGGKACRLACAGRRGRRGY